MKSFSTNRVQVEEQQLKTEQVSNSKEVITNAVLEEAPIIGSSGNPLCRRCRNHGLNMPWKGHKNKCQFKYARFSIS